MKAHGAIGALCLAGLISIIALCVVTPAHSEYVLSCDSLVDERG
jgi:hypothetical protein